MAVNDGDILGRVGGEVADIWRSNTVPSTVIHEVIADPLDSAGMYSVDVYLRVRRALMVEGMSVREAFRVFGLHRDTVRKMLAYSVLPGYRLQSSPRHVGPGLITLLASSGSQEPAAHRLAHLQAAEGRVRLRRRIHHRQGLRAGVPPSDKRDVRTAVPPAGPSPVRLRRGSVVHQRGAAQGPTASSWTCPTATSAS